MPWRPLPLLFAFVFVALPAKALRHVADLETALSGLCVKTAAPGSLPKSPLKFTGSPAIRDRVNAVHARFMALGLKPELAATLVDFPVHEVSELQCGRVEDAGGCTRGHVIQLSNRSISGAPLIISYGLIAHELGHRLNSKSRLSGPFGEISCRGRISSRAAGASEGFAEAVAAFAVDPEHLKRTCREAYDFIRTRVFNGEEAGCGAREDRAKVIAASGVSARPETKDADCDPSESPATKNVKSMTDIRDHVAAQAHDEHEEPVRETRSASEGGSSFGGLLNSLVPAGVQFFQMRRQQELQMTNTMTPQLWYFGTLPTGVATPAAVTPSTGAPSDVLQRLNAAPVPGSR